MASFNIDLEDGDDPIHFSLNGKDSSRLIDFMSRNYENEMRMKKLQNVINQLASKKDIGGRIGGTWSNAEELEVRIALAQQYENGKG